MKRLLWTGLAVALLFGAYTAWEAQRSRWASEKSPLSATVRELRGLEQDLYASSKLSPDLRIPKMWSAQRLYRSQDTSNVYELSSEVIRVGILNMKDNEVVIRVVKDMNGSGVKGILVDARIWR